MMKQWIICHVSRVFLMKSNICFTDRSLRIKIERLITEQKGR